MKKYCVIVFIAAMQLASCSKNGGSSGETKPTVTPAGTNDGTAVSKTIGNAGGTIISDDGDLELIIPSGALAANVTITLQPITNNAPGGRRNAYRLSPDGQQFAKDITLKFHYTDEDAAATKPDYMMAAFQTAEGTWQVIDKIENNVAEKTVNVSVNHFTDFTAFDAVRISPVDLYVKPFEQGDFELTIAGMSMVNGILFISNVIDNPETWKVNGVTGGSLGDGVIAKNNSGGATFTAPGVQPTINPAIVSAEIEFTFYVDGQRFNKGIVTANAHISGADYTIKVESEVTIGLGTLDKFVQKDQASYDVELSTLNGVVTHILNSNPSFQHTENGVPSCTAVWQTLGTGNIHYSDASKFEVFSTTEDVYISAGMHTGYIKPTILVSCTGVTPAINTVDIGDSNNQSFNFKNNGQPQVIKIGQGSGYSYTYTITPL